jgi:hypothetical protein
VVIILPENTINSQWVDSISCATKCIRTFKKEIDSFDSCYIKYSLTEPYFESNAHSKDLHLGLRKDINSDNVYRYTGAFFFDFDFFHMLKNAEEIEVEFSLEYDASNTYFIEDSTNDDQIFRNSVILKGHSFRNYYDMRTHWDNIAYTEFKTNYYCPFFCSIYEELRDALANKAKSFKFKLSNALLREFEKFGVKGLHLFCHNGLDGHFKINSKCHVKITRYKANYNNFIFSNDVAVFKNSREIKKAKIKKTKQIIDNTILCGHDRQHAFYFFGDKFNEAVKKAEQLRVTFNITWHRFSDENDLNDISINKNFSKSLIKIVGHSYKTIEEVKELNLDKYAIFELSSNGADYNPSLYENFDLQLKEGRTTFSFLLEGDKLAQFENMYGIRIGKGDDNSIGEWTLADHCELEIIKYKEDQDFFNYVVKGDNDWILEDKPTLIGANKKVSSLEHAGFYFFNGLNDLLNQGTVKSLRIRFNHIYDVFSEADNAYKKHFYVCGHNYKSLEDAQKDDYKRDGNILGIAKILERDNPEYSDFYITDPEIIEHMKQYDGICIFSMRNTTLSTHNTFLSIYVHYEEGEVEVKDRIFTYIPNDNNDIIANTYLNNSYDVDTRFLCGNIKGDLFKPFLFFKSDLRDFINSNIHVKSITIRFIAGESIEKEVNGQIYNSVMHLDDVELYAHDVVYDQIYCYCYQYTNKLCNIKLMTGQYTDVVSETIIDTVHLINALKNCYGIGAYALNASESEFINIKECQIIIRYTE